MLQHLLAGTEKRLAEIDQTIERQREVIAKRGQAGLDATREAALLTEFERFRDLVSNNREALLAEIGRLQ